MRITHHSMVDRVIENVQERLERISAQQDRMTTGLRVSKPSDDPTASARILALEARLRRGEQYTRNIQAGLHQLRMTETALTNANDILKQVRAKAVQGANDTTSTAGREALASEVDQLLSELLSVANQRNQGRYLFGGSDTRNTPYLAVRDDSGSLTEVRPQFDDSTRQVELIVGDGERMQMTVGAADAFETAAGDSVFTMLVDLRDALQNDDPDGTGEVLLRLDEALDQMNGLSSMLGARMNAAQGMIDRFDDTALEDQTQISELGDIDVVETLTRLNEEKTTYELALRTAAKVIQPSLVNFVYL